MATPSGRDPPPGQPPFEVLPGYWDKPCSFWQRIPLRSDTGGVAPMSIEGLEKYTNYRIGGMTPERRAWRKQWLEDQVLSHREPVHVPQLYYQYNHPMKRFFKYPFNLLQDKLEPYLGFYFARGVRRCLSLTIRGVFLFYVGTYYFLHHQNNWTKRGGLQVRWGKRIVYPNEPGYPFTSERTKAEDHADIGYNNSVLYKSEEQIRAEYAEELAKKKANLA